MSLEELLMDNKLPEEIIDKLLPALQNLAKHIAINGSTNDDSLKLILQNSGVPSEEWALEELACWSKILLKISYNNSEREDIVNELKIRGIPDFPAILVVDLMVDLCLGDSFSVEPRTIDFGMLKPQQEAIRTLTVEGALRRVIVKNNQM